MISQQRKADRHELKYLISHRQYLSLRSRVAAVMGRDSHAGENGYGIRSVYFDDCKDSAYHEKLWGISDRKKLRLRAYNNDPAYICLECKEKHGQWTHKTAAMLSQDASDALIKGDYTVLEGRTEPVCEETYLAFRQQGLHPSVAVDYHREAFVFPVSNLRVTFDRHLRAGSFPQMALFAERPEQEVTVPVFPDDRVIVEIKYDQYLPEIIALLLQDDCQSRLAVSKFCLCKEVAKSIHYT